jgi:hypothetical protein
VNRWLSLFGCIVVALTTTAGACQQEYDGELPTPAELGAAPFPTGAIPGDLEAIYARLTSEEPDGTQCFHLIRLSGRGEAQLGQGCSTSGAERIAADQATWSERLHVGDYAFRTGRIWLRVVSWDGLEESLTVDLSEFGVCGMQLRTLAGAGSTVVVRPYDLVAGAPPSNTPACDP